MPEYYERSSLYDNSRSQCNWKSNREARYEMGFMLAEKQNYEICEAIIEMFHKKEISVEQSYAILDYVKRKIAQDTKVGELVKISYEDFL